MRKIILLSFLSLVIASCAHESLIEVGASKSDAVTDNEIVLLQMTHEFLEDNYDYLGTLDVREFEAILKGIASGEVNEEESRSFMQETLRMNEDFIDYLMAYGPSIRAQYPTEESFLISLEDKYRTMLENGDYSLLGGHVYSTEKINCSWAAISLVFGGAGTLAAGCGSGVGCVGAVIYVATEFIGFCIECC